MIQLRSKNMNKELIKLACQERVEGRDLSEKGIKKIARKYQEKIKIPKNKIKKQFLLCFVGLVGSGKSTVAKLLSKKLGLIRIVSDEVRVILKKEGFNFKKVIDISKVVTSNYLDLGCSLALDGDSIQPQVRQYFNNLGRIKKIKIIWIHINTPEKQILSRMKSGNLSKFFSSSTEAISNYKRRKILHKQYLPSIDFYFKFDTAKDNLDLQIKKFINRLKKDSLL
jgi:predicted kinase